MLRASLLLVLAPLFWAGNMVVGKVVLEELDPLSLTFWRWLPAAVLLLVIAQLLERPDWRAVLRRWPVLLGMGLLGMVGYVLLLYTGLSLTSSLNASLINAANPALVTLLAVLLLREPFGWRKAVGIPLGIVGVIVVLTRGDVLSLVSVAPNPGDLLVLGAVVLWAAYTLLGRLARDIPPITATAVQAVFAVLALAPAVPFTGLQLPTTSGSWWGLAFIVLLPSVGAYLCFTAGMRRMPASTGAVFINLLPVFTALLGVALGQVIAPAQLLGGAIVIGAVLLTTGVRFGRAPVAGPPLGGPPAAIR
jgi:drug/metabolite transporter (DMT)-like permease